MNKKKRVVIFITTAFIGASGILYSLNPIDENQTEVNLVEKEETISQEKSKVNETAVSVQPTTLPEVAHIYVHICGEVKNPNVYQMKKTDRVIDVIALAGGLTASAAGDYINQAQSLEDGQKIYIPSKKEVENKELDWSEKKGETNQSGDQGSSQETTVVNLNQASKEELMTLPGIGEAKANSILEYRDKAGGFQKIEDIMKIEGIKEGVFNKIRDLITIN